MDVYKNVEDDFKLIENLAANTGNSNVQVLTLMDIADISVVGNIGINIVS
jgi:hypothetical protein